MFWNIYPFCLNAFSYLRWNKDSNNFVSCSMTPDVMVAKSSTIAASKLHFIEHSIEPSSTNNETNAESFHLQSFNSIQTSNHRHAFELFSYEKYFSFGVAGLTKKAYMYMSSSTNNKPATLCSQARGPRTFQRCSNRSTWLANQVQSVLIMVSGIACLKELPGLQISSDLFRCPKFKSLVFFIMVSLFQTPK